MTKVVKEGNLQGQCLEQRYDGALGTLHRVPEAREVWFWGAGSPCFVGLSQHSLMECVSAGGALVSSAGAGLGSAPEKPKGRKLGEEKAADSSPSYSQHQPTPAVARQ